MARKKVTKKPEISFEEARDRVEEIVRQLEDGKLGLSDSLEQYGEGIAHLKVCYEILEQAERKIEQLVNLSEDGEAQTAAFDDEQIPLEEKAKSRGRRRGNTRSTPADDTDGNEEDIDEPRGLF